MKIMAGKQLKSISITAVLIALCIAIVGSVGGVWAYLSAKTDTIDNEFLPAYVACRVEETFSGGVKSNVTIRNTGNVDAYIRAAVVATFVDDNNKVYAVSPKEGVDYNVFWATDGWTLGSDGFWYHADSVAPNALTSVLIHTAQQLSAPDGFSLNIQIVATAIQSTPESAVSSAWGITPANGKLIPN